MAIKFYIGDVWKNLRSVVKDDPDLLPFLQNSRIFSSPSFERVTPEGNKMVLAVSPGASSNATEPDETDDDMMCYLSRAGISGVDIGKTRYLPTEFIIAGKHFIGYNPDVDDEDYIDMVTEFEQRVFEALNNKSDLGDHTKHLGWSVSGVERVDPIGQGVQNGRIEIRFTIILSVNVIFKKRD